jgi:lipopolysaccharide export system permease protein
MHLPWTVDYGRWTAPMKLLDKYILKRFLTTFFFVVLILLAVITVIDITEKIDKYTKANLTTWEIMGYYLNYIPWIGSLLMPITIFIATVYVCSRMAAHTEIIAILSSGVSFKRLLLPFFSGALLIAILSFALNGWIIPTSSKYRLAFEMQYLKNKYYFDKRNIHFQVASNTYLYLQSYNNSSNTGYHFTLEKFRNNRLAEKLTASRIEWDTTKQKWTLREWKIKYVDSVFESASRPEASRYQAVKKMKARDSTRGGLLMDTALVIHPKEFENDYRKYEGMTMGELDEYILSLRERGSTGIAPYQVEKHSRYAAPFSIFILVFMGVIVSSRKSRGGTGLQIALGFALSFIFLIFFVLFRTIADAGDMPPQISVWIPNIIFGAISLVMYKFVPR